MSDISKSGQNAIQSKINTPEDAPQTESNKGTDKKGRSVTVENNPTKKLDATTSTQALKLGADLSTRNTTTLLEVDNKISSPNSVGQEQENKPDEVDAFFDEIKTIAQELSTEHDKTLAKTDEVAQKGMQKAKRNWKESMLCLLLGLVCAGAAIGMAFVCPPASILFAVAAITHALGGGIFQCSSTLCYIFASRDIDSMSETTELSKQASKLIENVFDTANENIKEQLKKNNTFEGVDLNQITTSFKNSFANPEVKAAVKNLTDNFKRNMFSKKQDKAKTDQQLINDMAQATRDTLDVFFAVIDDSLSGKNKTAVKEVATKCLQELVDSGPTQNNPATNSIGLTNKNLDKFNKMIKSVEVSQDTLNTGTLQGAKMFLEKMKAAGDAVLY